MADAVGPGRPVEGLREAGRFFREKGEQSRPIHAHGIDLIGGEPHLFTDHVSGEPCSSQAWSSSSSRTP